MSIIKNNFLIHNFQDTSEEIIEQLFNGNNFFVERIISNGQTSPDNFWYDQENNEWVIVIQGTAKIEFKNPDEILDLKPGDFVLIPAHKKHRVKETSKEQETIWLAVHYKTNDM